MGATATAFLTKTDNDSVLKTGIEIVGAALVVYYGLSLLKSQITKDQAASAIVNQTIIAQNNAQSAAALAQRLVNALQLGWTGNTDEEEVFAVLGTIGTAEFLSDVSRSYSLLSKGRVLLTDLKNGLDPTPFYTPDWDRAKARIALINKYHRKPAKK